MKDYFLESIARKMMNTATITYRSSTTIGRLIAAAVSSGELTEKTEKLFVQVDMSNTTINLATIKQVVQNFIQVPRLVVEFVNAPMTEAEEAAYAAADAAEVERQRAPTVKPAPVPVADADAEIPHDPTVKVVRTTWANRQEFVQRLADGAEIVDSRTTTVQFELDALEDINKTQIAEAAADLQSVLTALLGREIVVTVNVNVVPMRFVISEHPTAPGLILEVEDPQANIAAVLETLPQIAQPVAIKGAAIGLRELAALRLKFSHLQLRIEQT